MTSPSALTGNVASLPQAAAAVSAQSSSSATSAAAVSDGLSNPNTFITLLTAQLKAQDPFNPMSPSEMVNQLTQINSLQQLIQIQQDLQSILGLSVVVVQPSAAQAAPQVSVSQPNSSTSNTLATNQ
jgi:flagellar hook assembly protein FlgD